MNCPMCGAENPEGAKFCNLCMSRFGEAESTSGVDAPTSPHAPSQADPTDPPGPPRQPPDGELLLDSYGFPVEPYQQEVGTAPAPLPGQAGSSPGDVFGDGAPSPSDARFGLPVLPGAPGKVSIPTRDLPTGALSVYGYAAAVGVVGALFLRAVIEIIRFFFVNDALAFQRIDGWKETGKYFTGHGDIITVLLILITVFALSFMMGYRVQRYGYVVGAVTAASLCALDGLLSLFKVGLLSRMLEVVRGLPDFYPVYFFIGLVALSALGAGAGWLGEFLADRLEGVGWPYERIFKATAGGLAIMMLLTVCGGFLHLIVFAKGTRGELTKVFQSMEDQAGWTAEMTFTTVKEYEGLMAEIEYEKGRGYLQEVISANTTQEWFYHDTAKNERYWLGPNHPKGGPDWKSVGSANGIRMFDKAKVENLTLLDRHRATFMGQEAICFDVEGDGDDLAFISAQCFRIIPWEPVFANRVTNRFEGQIWTDRKLTKVLCFTGYLRDNKSQDSPIVANMYIIFENFGKKLLEFPHTPSG